MNNDEDDDDEGMDVVIHYEQEFSMIRLVEDHFLSSHLMITAQVFPMTSASEQDLEIAFQKVTFWLENIVSRCIAFNRDNAAAKKMLIDDGKNNSSNILMLTPGDPTDEMMGVLLQSKMTALAENKVVFGSVDVKSNNWAGLRFTFVGDSAQLLPEMQDWVGVPNFFSEPWWDRDDASTLDVVFDPAADAGQKPAWAYKLDFIANALRPPHEAIARPIFKPKVIDGGKKDE